MFGKVLLLALVCVAATEVRGCNTEDALLEAENIRNQVANSIRHVLDVYIQGYLDFERTIKPFWRTNWEYTRWELKLLENDTVEVNNMAWLNLSPDEVYTCIEERANKTNEVLRVMPWAFQDRYKAEVERFYNERSRLVVGAQNHMDTYRDHYWDYIVPAIKKCETDECRQEILNTYQNDYEKMTEEFAPVFKKMDSQSEEFKVMADSRLLAGRKTLSYARVAGVNEMKECLQN